MNTFPERDFFTRLLVGRDDQEYGNLLVRGFRKEVFLPEVIPALTYIQDYYRDYGELPTPRQLGKKFPEFGEGLFSDKVPEEPLRAIYEELREVRMGQAERELITEAARQIKGKEDPEAVLRQISESVGELSARFRISASDGGTYDELLDKSFATLMQGRKLTGMAVPLIFMHEQIGGLQPGEITALAATPGVGKTWMALMTAITVTTGNPFYFYNKSDLHIDQNFLTEEEKEKKKGRCLLVSYEMPVIDVVGRLASLYARVSYNRFASGKLTDSEKAKVQKHLNWIKSGEGVGHNLKIIGPGEAPEPDSVDAIAHEFGADIVILDAFYHMPGVGDDRWKQVEGNMAKIRINSLSRNHHYLLTTQLRRDVKKLEEANLDSLAFSVSIGHDSNNVIIAGQTEQEKKERQVGVKLAKARGGSPTDIYLYNWDHYESRYTEISMKDEGFDFIEH